MSRSKGRDFLCRIRETIGDDSRRLIEGGGVEVVCVRLIERRRWSRDVIDEVVE